MQVITEVDDECEQWEDEEIGETAGESIEDNECKEEENDDQKAFFPILHSLTVVYLWRACQFLPISYLIYRGKVGMIFA